MNAPSKIAAKLATEIGKPENVDMIERQLVAKHDLAQLYQINRAAIDRAAIDRSLAYDRARLSAVSLSHEEQIALASYIIDHLDHVSDDDLRNAAVDAIGLLV